RFAKAFSEVKPLQPGGITLYFGGASGAAATVAARHCDVYALWGEPLAAVKQRIADIHDKAAAFGRRPRISVSLRPIIAPTESQAWERARRILATVMEARPSVVGEGAGLRPQAVGARRLVDFARESEVHDKRLWTPIAAAMGGAGVSASLLNLADHRVSFADGRPPEKFDDDTGAVVARVAGADCVLLASPVYRGTFTGALKNLLDLTPIEGLRAKPVGIVAMGATSHHYLGVDWQLRAVLAWFGARVVPTSVYLESAHLRD